jgi:hypothetical protein
MNVRPPWWIGRRPPGRRSPNGPPRGELRAAAGPRRARAFHGGNALRRGWSRFGICSVCGWWRRRVRLRRDRRFRRRHRLRRDRGRRGGDAAAIRRRRRRGRRRRRSRSHRKQRLWIDIAVVVVRHADAQMHVWDVELGRSTRSDRSDRRRLVDARARAQRERTQMRERDRVPVRGLDAQRQPVARRRARKRDNTSSRSHNSAVGGSGNVDAAALSTCVRMCAVKRERPQDRPLDRPRPRRRATRQGKSDHDRAECEEPQG